MNTAKNGPNESPVIVPQSTRLNHRIRWLRRAQVIALLIIGLALIGVLVSACGSSPSCHVVTHKGHRECVGQKKVSGPSGPLFIPVYWPIGYPAPGFVYRPPPVEVPIEAPPVEEPVIVDDAYFHSGPR